MADLQNTVNDTIQDLPKIGERTGTHNLVLYLSQVNDLIEPWEGSPSRRDQQMAQFWKTEPFLASAVNSIAMTRSALSWELTGPPKTVDKVQKILNGADFNQGWQHLMMQVNIDLLTSDNGAFIEVIRKKPTNGQKPESMPVIGLAHLPSIQCVRTGNPLQPVTYITRLGKEIDLQWYQVLMLAENPIPESLTGRQFCFVSRVLKFSVMIRDVIQHHSEKIGGRFNKVIHVVSGVAPHEMENVQTNAAYTANNMGLTNYGPPIILTTLDPNAKPTKVTLELATLPDGFDMNTIFNWYITLLALASGSDYQEFAPLSTGNLGTASQSDTLHRKAQRKGTQLFIKMIETSLHQFKVVPESVTFRFRQQDAQAELEHAEIEQLRAATRAAQIASQEITPEVARQIAVDKGDLLQEYLLLMGETDATVDVVTVPDDGVVSEELMNKSLDVQTAWRAASWMTQVLSNHPLQSISPIPSAQVLVFRDALRNILTKATAIGTTEAWLSKELIAAAQEAGINPVALRSRLPNNYQLLVTPNVIKDNRGSIVYKGVTKAVVVEKELQLPLNEFRKEFEATHEKMGVILKFLRQYTNDKALVTKVLKDCQLLLQVTQNPDVYEMKIMAALSQAI